METNLLKECLTNYEAEEKRARGPENEEQILMHYTAHREAPASVDAWSIPQDNYVALPSAMHGATFHPRKGADR